MKRLWFAVVFLALAGVMCFVEQEYINCFYDEVSAKINTAETALENENYRLYEKSTKDIENIWKNKNDFLYAFGEHKELDDIAISIRSMPYDEKDAKKELRSLKAQLYAYYENERISLSNIF